jgi:hypothetical protein
MLHFGHDPALFGEGGDGIANPLMSPIEMLSFVEFLAF